jgi:anti-sigma factor RsiW
MADHLETCLACQAELAGYRRLLRALRSLRDEPVLFPSPELIGETLTALSERLVDRRRRPADQDKRERWLVACALVAMAAAAVGVGAVFARSGAARSGRGSRAVAGAL